MDQRFNNQLGELLKTGRGADREDKARAESFEALMKHPAWDTYLLLLNNLIQRRAEELMSPAGSVDGAVALEYVKGTMSGLIMARDIPSITIAAMKAASTNEDSDG